MPFREMKWMNLLQPRTVVFAIWQIFQLWGFGMSLKIRRKWLDDPRTHFLEIPERPINVSLYIITSASSEQRFGQLMESWGNIMLNHRRVELYFMALEGNRFPHLKSRSLIPGPELARFQRKVLSNSSGPLWKQRMFALKDLIIFHHCFNETRADFCIRITDDVYLNLRAFSGLLKWLGQVERPHETSVVIGDCVELIRRGVMKYWIQGGSGYVLSRYAVSRFLKIGKKWVSRIPKKDAEDVWFAKMAWRKLGISPVDFTSPFFNGHFLTAARFASWNWSDPRYFRQCPSVFRKNCVCGNYLAPYSSVVFHHSMGHFMNQYKWEKWIESVPKDAIIYNNGLHGAFCKARKGPFIWRTRKRENC
jgi:hypothetical protein